jgi:hypothetical protein
MKSSITIELSTAELMIAASVGAMRRVSSLKRRMDTDRHAPHSSWATDIDGAAAEQAVSKHLGRYWGGHIYNFNGDDVSGGIQVRSTSYHDGCLIIRESDADNSIFVLVVASAPSYTIIGWIKASDAKKAKYFRQGNGAGSDAWWVKQSDLIDMLTILTASKV